MKVLSCPICKANPVLKVTDMGGPRGMGYPGCFAWTYRCPKCGLISGGSDTVYTPRERVEVEAIKSWNREVNRMRVIMGRKPLQVKED